jgi:hypothetical protein
MGLCHSVGDVPIRRKQRKKKAERTAAAQASTTKSQSQETQNSSETSETETKAEELAPIPLRRESMCVIGLMYPKDSNPAQGGKVRWIDFVKLMADAGFVATEAYGSAVNFSNGMGGHIQFRKPHPHPMIEPLKLYLSARRMRKGFDWSRERFVLREKAN